MLQIPSSAGASASTVVIELHHYHYLSHPVSKTYADARVPELCAESPPQSWAELPSNDYTGHSVSRDHGRLPTIFEEPPYVDMSNKPTEDMVREAICRRL